MKPPFDCFCDVSVTLFDAKCDCFMSVMFDMEALTLEAFYLFSVFLSAANTLSKNGEKGYSNRSSLLKRCRVRIKQQSQFTNSEHSCVTS